jgi:hypothetical protein
MEVDTFATLLANIPVNSLDAQQRLRAWAIELAANNFTGFVDGAEAVVKSADMLLDYVLNGPPVPDDSEDKQPDSHPEADAWVKPNEAPAHTYFGGQP